mmetsp:Transcript_5886/g.16729  ORF Transcript_5886/g.16729 Transcript_5886/m.16729 type:complete len:315 (+) Transcript_5886:1785-2729(+)
MLLLERVDLFPQLGVVLLGLLLVLLGLVLRLSGLLHFAEMRGVEVPLVVFAFALLLEGRLHLNLGLLDLGAEPLHLHRLVLPCEFLALLLLFLELRDGAAEGGHHLLLLGHLTLLGRDRRLQIRHLLLQTHNDVPALQHGVFGRQLTLYLALQLVDSCDSVLELLRGVGVLLLQVLALVCQLAAGTLGGRVARLQLVSLLDNGLELLPHRLHLNVLEAAHIVVEDALKGPQTATGAVVLLHQLSHTPFQPLLLAPQRRGLLSRRDEAVLCVLLLPVESLQLLRELLLGAAQLVALGHGVAPGALGRPHLALFDV